MSRASKLTLAATGLGTAGIIYFVHWAQENDRAVGAELPFFLGMFANSSMCHRLCTEVSSAIWKSSASEQNARPISRCRNDSKRNTLNSRPLRLSTFRVPRGSLPEGIIQGMVHNANSKLGNCPLLPMATWIAGMHIWWAHPC